MENTAVSNQTLENISLTATPAVNPLEKNIVISSKNYAVKIEMFSKEGRPDACYLKCVKPGEKLPINSNVIAIEYAKRLGLKKGDTYAIVVNTMSKTYTNSRGETTPTYTYDIVTNITEELNKSIAAKVLDSMGW
jgi:hypothetical protein